MSERTIVLALVLAPVVALAAPVAKSAPRPPSYKLLPGAEGKLCIDCHVQFQDVLKKPVLHTPVKNRQCAGCHNPHASRHKKFLSGEVGQVCLKCHEKVVPKDPKSTHKPVVEGKCVACHDPHASANKNTLVKPLEQLCAGCHEKIAAATKGKYKHRPVEDGCGNCHDPHGSAAGPSLLKTDVPALCTGCHKPEKALFVKAHLEYPVAKARCTSCHESHGSDKRALLYNTVHAPVAKGQCPQCHQAARSPDALKTRVESPALCRGCHSEAMNAMEDKGRLHRPVAEGRCLACHSAHAAKEKGLLQGGMLAVCGSCHADTLARQKLSPTKHAPVAEGKCSACHSPHSSDVPLALTKPTVLETCGTCHDGLTHMSHPMGDKVIDPRNRNLTMQCLTCHRAHGTEYKHLMPYATTSDLCTKCHEKFKR